MYINFRSISIEGFNSIDRVNLEFNEQGVVLVRGINDYEENSKSNGSGKSSIFNALLWAIYGQTANGIANPTNRYLNKGCSVRVDFSIDNTEYSITRSIKHKKNGTGVKLEKSGEDISGRNKTDTDNIIKSDVISISKDIFLSTIFLSQGFNNRISVLTPSGRKERIEVLAGTDNQVDSFKNKVSSAKSLLTDSYNKTNNDISYRRGSIDRIESQITSIERKVEEAKKDVPDGDPVELNNEISVLEEENTTITNSMYKLSDKKNALSTQLSKSEADARSYKKSISDYKSKLSRLSEDSVCPTCGQVIDKDKKEALKKEYSNAVSALADEYIKSADDSKVLESKVSTLTDKIEEFRNRSIEISNQLLAKRSLLLELSKNRDITDDINNLNNLKSEIHDLTKEIDDLSKELSETEKQISIANHCVQIITKSFRGYLLSNVIDFINVRTAEYSKVLFSNESDIVSLVVDGNKLDIYLGDSQYETLSGGEQRKVDIILVLAQRDMSLSIANVTSNILILDEVLDNLDEIATNSVLSLIGNVANTVESIFIISHNNYDIAYDKIITIHKGQDRLSHIEIF